MPSLPALDTLAEPVPPGRSAAPPAAAGALALAVAAADALLRGHDAGLGLVLFLAALPPLAGAVAARAGRAPSPAAWLRAAALTLAALMPLVEQSNALTVTVAVLGTFFTCLSLQGLMAAGWGSRVVELAAQTVLAPLRWLPVLRGAVADGGEATGAALRWALPLLFAAVFVALLAEANPLVARLVAVFDLGAMLGWLFSERSLFSIAMAVFAAPFLHAGAPWAGRIAMGLAALAMLRPVGSDAARLAATNRETAFALRALVLFNVVFAVQTVSDAAFLWAGAALPAGTTYAEYAHRGAYALLVTAVLAAVFVVWATRPRGPGEASPAVARLVLVWVAQNLLLLAASAQRLHLYVDAYALTHWRVAAAVWMALVAAGFVLVVVRALSGRSLAWLVSANVAVLAATLYAVSFNDWTDTIARHNLGTQRADLRHVESLGPAALPAIVAHRRAVGPGALDCSVALVERRLRARVTPFDWRERTRRRARVAAVAAQPMVIHEPLPQDRPRRRAQCGEIVLGNAP